MAEQGGGKKRTYSPTGKTPKPVTKRGVGSDDRNVPTEQPRRPARRRLTYQHQPLYTPSDNWGEQEDETLTQFVLFSCAGDSWPTTKSTKFWESASKFLHDTCKTVRTSKEY